MKKYIIKYADGKECSELKSSYKSRNEASNALMEYIYNNNEYLNISDDDFLSIFDFKLEEVERTEVNDVITDFKSAKKAIAADFYLSADKSKLAASLMNDINPKHIEALDILNKLFTIAEVWNKEDGFVPNFSDEEQEKWFPWFKYDKDATRFVYSGTIYPPEDALLGSRLCFKTHERAGQFGKQFEDLYNKVFL